MTRLFDGEESNAWLSEVGEGKHIENTHHWKGLTTEFGSVNSSLGTLKTELNRVTADVAGLKRGAGVGSRMGTGFARGAEPSFSVGGNADRAGGGPADPTQARVGFKDGVEEAGLVRQAAPDQLVTPAALISLQRSNSNRSEGSEGVGRMSVVGGAAGGPAERQAVPRAEIEGGAGGARGDTSLRRRGATAPSQVNGVPSPPPAPLVARAPGVAHEDSLEAMLATLAPASNEG